MQGFAPMLPTHTQNFGGGAVATCACRPASVVCNVHPPTEPSQARNKAKPRQGQSTARDKAKPSQEAKPSHEAKPGYEAKPSQVLGP